MKRYDTLDAMRGVAAFLIILRHTSAFWGGISFRHSYLAVDFFFLLSGFVVCHAYEAPLKTSLSVLQFMKLRLIRLYPLYFIGFVLSLLALALKFYTLPYSGWTLSAVLAAGALLIPFPSQDQIFPLNGPAWSLWCELAGNFIYAAAMRFLSDRVLGIVVAICGVMVVAAVLLSHRGGLDVGFTLNTLPLAFARFGFSFGLGVLLRRRQPAIKGRLKTLPGLAFLPLIMLFNVLAFPDFGRAWADIYALICVFVIFPFLVWFAAGYQPSPWLLPAFRGLGASSYPVYILQVPVAVLAEGVMRNAGYPPERFAPYSGMIFMVVITALAFVLVRYVEQPVRQRLRHLAQITRVHVWQRLVGASA